MPVRAIKQIKSHNWAGRLVISTPQAIARGILSQYHEESCIFVCEFKKHFDSNKKVIAEINQSTELRRVGAHDVGVLDSIILTDTPLMIKFGFLAGEYLEIIFKEVKITTVEDIFFSIFSRRKTKTIPIFIDRMVEDLDFVPE